MFTELVVIKVDWHIFIAWQVHYHSIIWIIEHLKHLIIRFLVKLWLHCWMSWMLWPWSWLSGNYGLVNILWCHHLCMSATVYDWNFTQIMHIKSEHKNSILTDCRYLKHKHHKNAYNYDVKVWCTCSRCETYKYLHSQRILKLQPYDTINTCVSLENF